ncbi:hypothetical protein M422DRAFT_263667 [Sphaerobolus stellatus SS14]|uniref:Uncharacterized protein n=1 Tax=Sphaerobolus stellatus (strain SS14) TaxID=990650 RepID=A0A0C9UHN1_SPHS4|nr:hypothetical protein M422DRAFT_263667 [Sphaerobolus stellatus SS14]
MAKPWVDRRRRASATRCLGQGSNRRSRRVYVRESSFPSLFRSRLSCRRSNVSDLMMASVRPLDMDTRKALRTPSTWDMSSVAGENETGTGILEGPKGRVVDIDAHFGGEGEGQVRVDTSSIEFASLGDRNDPDMPGGAIRELNEGKRVEEAPSYLDIANTVLATLVAALALAS